jgi:hypothetical protein
MSINGVGKDINIEIGGDIKILTWTNFFLHLSLI